MIDYHVHSSYSGDCAVPMARMAHAAQKAGISELCFTEHIDIDAPGETDFVVDMDAYRAGFLEVQRAFTNLTLRFGVEAGLDISTMDRLAAMIEGQPLDYVVGSQHMVFGCDPYHNTLWERYTQREIFDEYMRTGIECAAACDFYDVLGHLGYIGKFCPHQDKLLRYSDYTDAIDVLLKTLIDKGKGLEVNTNGLLMTLSTMPETPVIARYYKLGGEIITIGSDAHREDIVGLAVPQTLAALSQIGFRYVCAFDRRKPRFIPIA